MNSENPAPPAAPATPELFYERKSGQHRPLTGEELAEATALLAERQALVANLRQAQRALREFTQRMENERRHAFVFCDTPGMPYDVRHFVLTGRERLI